MKSIQAYNQLNGKVVTRTDLKEIVELAESEEQTFIAEKLKNILFYYPKAERFDVDLDNMIQEQFPASMLGCIDEFPEQLNDEVGLAKAVKPDDIYQMITDKLLAQYKEASGTGYKKKWKKQNMEGYLIPFNWESKKPYRGINIMLLTDGMSKVMENPFFLTFKQIQSNKGKLKKGSKGLPVVYFTRLYLVDETGKDGKKIEFGTYDVKKYNNFIDRNASNLKRDSSFYKNKYIPILKYYNVFSGADVEGIDFDLDNFKTGYQSSAEITKNDDPRIELADAIVENYPKPQPKLIHHKQDKAFYLEANDSINMPSIEDFETASDYYRTLLHEFTHSTGVYDRLNREEFHKYHTAKKHRAKEELVAEMGAVFLSAYAGIIWHNNTNHSEYLKNWGRALEHIEKDNRFLMRAASAAQASTDFVLNYNTEGVPAYLSKVGKKKKVENEVKPKKETKAKPKKKEKTHTFKPGDLYRSDFDYEGMLDFAEKVNDKTSLSVLKKLAESMRDVNYHDEAKKIEDLIEKKESKGESLPELKIRNKKYDLFRHHSESFQKQIEKGNFVIDKSRKFNDTGRKKNLAEFYFYSLSQKGAEQYKNDETKLFEYSFNGKLLDVKNEENKKYLKNTINYLVKKENDTRKSMRENVSEKHLDPLAKKNATVEDIINDNRIDSSSFWGQRLSDYEAGLYLKKDLKTLGIDGIIFKEEFKIAEPEVLLLNPAQSIKKPSTPKKTVSKKQSKPSPKVDYNGQYALLGAKQKEGMKFPEVKVKAPSPKPNKVRSASNQVDPDSFEFFNVPGQVGEFLQRVERKPKESVVITIDGKQGAGKTTMLYQFMEAFTKGGNRSLFASLEQHPDSILTQDKINSYISPQNRKLLDLVGDFEDKNEFYSIIEYYDIIFIDSWQKLLELIGTISLDQDLRKKFDSKVFVVVFQQTTTGRTKGGASIVFDGDIIIKMETGYSFAENYAFFDKNRYTQVPIEKLRYNIAEQKVYDPTATEDETKTENEPSNEAIEVIELD